MTPAIASFAHHPRQLLMLAAAACSALAPVRAHADEWAAAANLGSYAEFNDNPRLAADGGESVAGIVADLGAVLSWRAPTASLAIVPRVVVRRYTGNYALSSDDYYLTADYQLAAERSTLELSTAFSREGTATSDFVSTGYVEQNLPREAATIQASTTVNFSERSLVSGSLSYERVVFVGGLSYGLLDYDYVIARAYVQRALSDRTRLQVISRLAWMQVPQTGGASREVTAGMGLEHDWNERWRSNLSIGPSYSETDVVSNGISTSYRADLTGSWQLTQFAFTAQRLLSPTAGRGQLESRDDLEISGSRRLGEHWTVNGLVSAAFYSDASNPRYQGGQSRSYARAYAALAWQASPQWSWRLAVTHERQDAGVIGEGTRVTLGATWSGSGKALSR
jgi:hypothetical protein